MAFPYLIHNGRIVSKSHPIPIESLINRGLYYGDGFFDTQFLIDGKSIRNWYFHQKRLLASFENMGLTPITALVEAEKYQQLIGELMQKNELKRANCNHIIRIQCWRNGGRGYACANKDASYLVECISLKENILQEIAVTSFALPKPIRAGLPNNLKSSSAYQYVQVANRHKDVAIILLDEQQNALESLNASIFWVKEDRLYVPEQTDDLLFGVSRMVFTELCQSQNNPIIESSLALADIQSQNLIFLANAVNPFCVINKWDNHTLPAESMFFEQLKKNYLEFSNKYSLEIH